MLFHKHVVERILFQVKLRLLGVCAYFPGCALPLLSVTERIYSLEKTIESF